MLSIRFLNNNFILALLFFGMFFSIKNSLANDAKNSSPASTQIFDGPEYEEEYEKIEANPVTVYEFKMDKEVSSEKIPYTLLYDVYGDKVDELKAYEGSGALMKLLKVEQKSGPTMVCQKKQYWLGLEYESGRFGWPENTYRIGTYFNCQKL